jgi:hypothetical protein
MRVLMNYKADELTKFSMEQNAVITREASWVKSNEETSSIRVRERLFFSFCRKTNNNDPCY